MPSLINPASCRGFPENPDAMKDTPIVRYSSSGSASFSIFPNGVELVTTPNFVVGELCPLVKPYTPLSITTAQILRFLAAWGAMCSPPILRKSPSPATTTTLRSGRPIFTPIDIGRLLP